MPPRCAYRSSARKTSPIPPPRTGVSRSSALSLACLAASGITTAGVVGSLELAALAAAGAVVAGAHAWRARRTLRAHDMVLAYLGGRTGVRTARGWCSSDGTRRVRRSADGRLLFEELLADGTARVYRGPLPDDVRLAPASGTYESCGVFALYGRAVRPACFVGLPSALGGEPYHRPAAHVRMERNADGVRLLRFDARGRDVGETVHDSEAAAARQLEAEFGAHLGPRRTAPPRGRRTSGWEHTDTPERAL
ncbi:MAG: hypothetical protein AB8I08_07485 [Sandaracinaceae bacterium]